MKTIARLEDLTPDPANANSGTLRGTQLLDTSVEKFGGGRSILVDANGVVIAGNKTLDISVARGFPAKVVQSDGSHLVVVQRVDLDLDDPQTRELAYLDNRTSEVGLSWNPEQLEKDLASGIQFGGMFTQLEIDTILVAMDTLDRAAYLGFDEDGARRWQALQVLLDQRYAHLPKANRPDDQGGERFEQWVTDQLDKIAAEAPDAH